MINKVCAIRVNLSIALAILLLPSLAHPQTALPHEIKGAYLLNFIGYFTWQDEEQFARYQIGIVGDDRDIFQTLQIATENRAIEGKPILVVLASDIQTMRDSQVLYVSSSSSVDLPVIARDTRRSNTLLVTENQVDKTHFMLNLILEANNTISFEINRPNIVYEGLQMSNDLMLLGGTELDVAELIASIEGEMVDANLRLEAMEEEFFSLQQESLEQQALVDSQLNTITSQSNTIDGQSMSLDEKNSAVEESNNQLLELESLLAVLDQSLESSQSQLALSENDIRLSQLEIDEKNALMNEQASRIAENSTLLARQISEITMQSSLLQSQQTQANQQNIVIENYRAWIQIASATLALFVLLIGVTLWINNKRTRSNALLSDQNRELEITKSELQIERDRADKANEAKGNFLANMSHEIRSPMNAILGYSELLQLDSQDQKLHKKSINAISAIRRNGEHLLNLVNSVLNMSKIDAGKVEVITNNFELSILPDDMINMFIGNADALGVKLTSNIDQGVPKFINADEAKIRQILVNLLSNAMKFTTQGGITLNISSVQIPDPSNEASSEDHNHQVKLCFEVADTGCGIPPTELETIFGAFEQTSTGRQALNGTGLGLSISRYHARLLGGDIIVSSTQNVGSTFTCTIPAQTCPVPMIRSHRNVEMVTGIKGLQSNYKILIVDDSNENRDLLMQFLHLEGFSLKQAINGKQAVEMVQKWDPDLILMDLSMPVMDGTEAIRIIKGIPSTKSPKIVAVTANVFEEQRTAIMNIGADGYIRKPFSRMEILSEVGEQLSIEYLFAQPEVGSDDSVEHPENSVAAKRKLSSQQIFEELKSASLELDIERIGSLITEIEYSDSKLAGQLRALADSYQYEKIEQLVNSMRPK